MDLLTSTMSMQKFRHMRKLHKLVVLAATVLFMPALRAQNVDSTPSGTSTAYAIEPMTHVDVIAHTGYFGDPYPIRRLPWLEPFLPQYFSGTTPALLDCDHPIKPGCFSESSLSITISDGLKAQASASGNAFYDAINHNIFQGADGQWEMAITLYLHKAADKKVDWTVIAHAHPTTDPFSLEPPSEWTVDTILVGSIATEQKANYDGKYLEDGGKLYLIYSKRLISHPVEHDGIVAQAMESSTVVAANSPVVLLAPDDTNGGFNSEYFHTVPPPADTFKLIETGNITRINGKYVMAYSAGDYQQRDYKTGIAFSDTLLPAMGKTYRKILMEDTAGVWGQSNHREVRYLLQSQKPDWPNYIGNQVIAPGVPSIVKQLFGTYLLFFDGFQPGDTPAAPDTSNPLDYNPTHRRPWYIDVKVKIPDNKSVSTATDAELATWIMLRTNSV